MLATYQNQTLTQENLELFGAARLQVRAENAGALAKWKPRGISCGKLIAFLRLPITLEAAAAAMKLQVRYPSQLTKLQRNGDEAL